MSLPPTAPSTLAVPLMEGVHHPRTDGPEPRSSAGGASTAELAHSARSRAVEAGQPWTDSWFWILQIVILALYLLRLAATVAFHLDIGSAALEYSTLALFIIPVVYVALRFGLTGAAFTAAWFSLLGIPRIVSAASAHDAPGVWSEVVQLLLLDVLALVIGYQVAAERRASTLAEEAHRERLGAVALYRDLFESNRAPILIVDASGSVVEANPSAARVFEPLARTVHDRSTTASPNRLIDVIGATAASYVLARLIDPPTESADRQAGGGRRGEPIAFTVGGETALFRPTATVLHGPDVDRRVQVVFEDVTAETRRHELMEEFASQVVMGQEEERRHLAQELHDGPLQDLIHLCRQIDAIDPASPARANGQTGTHELRAIVEGAIGELRSIARGLRPPVLDDLGLVESINQLLSETAEREQLDVGLGVTGTARRLEPGIELALFRIAQEALSNVGRHAAASRIAMGLDFDGGSVRMLITDDGIGFETPADVRDTGGSLGLPGMAERARLIGARLAIHSVPEGGTTVEVLLPATDLAG